MSDPTVLQDNIQRLLERWAEKPVDFVCEALVVQPEMWQANVLDAVLSERRVVVQGPAGCGLTTVSAWVALHYLTSFPFVEIFSYQPTKETREAWQREFRFWFYMLREHAPYLFAQYEEKDRRFQSVKQPESALTIIDDLAVLDRASAPKVLVALDHARSVPPFVWDRLREHPKFDAIVTSLPAGHDHEFTRTHRTWAASFSVFPRFAAATVQREEAEPVATSGVYYTDRHGTHAYTRQAPAYLANVIGETPEDLAHALVPWSCLIETEDRESGAPGDGHVLAIYVESLDGPRISRRLARKMSGGRTSSAQGDVAAHSTDHSHGKDAHDVAHGVLVGQKSTVRVDALPEFDSQMINAPRRVVFLVGKGGTLVHGETSTIDPSITGRDLEHVVTIARNLRSRFKARSYVTNDLPLVSRLKYVDRGVYTMFADLWTVPQNKLNRKRTDTREYAADVATGLALAVRKAMLAGFFAHAPLPPVFRATLTDHLSALILEQDAVKRHVLTVAHTGNARPVGVVHGDDVAHQHGDRQDSYARIDADQFTHDRHHLNARVDAPDQMSSHPRHALDAHRIDSAPIADDRPPAFEPVDAPLEHAAGARTTGDGPLMSEPSGAQATDVSRSTFEPAGAAHGPVDSPMNNARTGAPAWDDRLEVSEPSAQSSDDRQDSAVPRLRTVRDATHVLALLLYWRNVGPKDEEIARTRVNETRFRSLESLKHWDEIELRLRQRWTPGRVLRWFKEMYPNDYAPEETTLYRFLKTKDESWFVRSLFAALKEKERLPRVNVLEEQAELIEVLKMRIELALHHEKDGELSSEVRHNLLLLSQTLDSHFRIQQELGLQPSAPRHFKIDERSEKHVFHHAFEFLDPIEAKRMIEMEGAVERGELSVLDLYKSVAGVFQVEQQQRAMKQVPFKKREVSE